MKRCSVFTRRVCHNDCYCYKGRKTCRIPSLVVYSLPGWRKPMLYVRVSSNGMGVYSQMKAPFNAPPLLIPLSPFTVYVWFLDAKGKSITTFLCMVWERLLANVISDWISFWCAWIPLTLPGRRQFYPNVKISSVCSFANRKWKIDYSHY